MAKVAVAIEAWKLAIFTKHLDAGLFTFTKHPGVTPDTLFLKVKTDRIAALQRVVEAAQLECKTQ